MSSGIASEREKWQSDLEAEYVPRGVDASLIAALAHEEDQTYEGVRDVLEALASTGDACNDVRQDSDRQSKEDGGEEDGGEEDKRVEQMLEEWKRLEVETNLAENLHLTDEEDGLEEGGREAESGRGKRATEAGLGDGEEAEKAAEGKEGMADALAEDAIQSRNEPTSDLAFLLHAFPSRTLPFLKGMLKDEGGVVEQVIDTLAVMEMVENGELNGDSESEKGEGEMKSKTIGMDYDLLERGTNGKKKSKNDRRQRRENAMGGKGEVQKINLTDIRQGALPSSHLLRKTHTTGAPVLSSEPEDDAAMAVRLAAEERKAAGLGSEEEGEVDAAVQDNDWLFSSSILDQLTLLLDMPFHKVRSAHNSTHFNLRATAQRLINVNCIDFPSLASLDGAGGAPSGSAATIVDGLALLLPSKSRSEVERSFRGTKGRQDATLDLLQLLDVVEKSASGERTDVLDPMKTTRGNQTSIVTADTVTQQASDRQGRFHFVGQKEAALAPAEVPYSQITKRSMRDKTGSLTAPSASRQHALNQLKAGAPSTSYPLHSAHIDANSSSDPSSSTSSAHSSSLFEGAKRHETQSEAQRLATEYRSIALEYRARREQSLMQAAQAYRSLPGGGASKQVKGAAAWVYADEARRLDAKARAFSLKAAQATVRHRMMTGGAIATGNVRQAPNVVDLHGLTVHESLSITKEALSAWWAKSSSGTVHPLYIVTGVGRHSRGNVAVIRPAILKMLQRDGWVVHERQEGQIAVQGLR